MAATWTSSSFYGQEEVARLFRFTDYIRLAAVVLVALLTFVAFIFINTIRLSITARRREIAIMRLVGASNGFIRGPFVAEGVLQALLGSLLAIGCLELVRNFLMPLIRRTSSSCRSTSPWRCTWQPTVRLSWLVLLSVFLARLSPCAVTSRSSAALYLSKRSFELAVRP